MCIRDSYGESLGAKIQELKSNAINSNRAVEYARGGNIDVGGPVPFELPILGIGSVLKHALGGKVTTGAGPYVHTLKRGALPAGLSIEKGFTDIAQYIVYRGCKVDKLSINIPVNGLVTGTLDLKGKDHAESGTSLGTPTAVAHAPYAEQDAVLLEGGGAVTLLGLSFDVTNELDVVEQIGSRFPAAITEGKGECTGTVTVMFENLTMYNKWKNETATSLTATLTQGAASIAFSFPNVRYFEDSHPKIASGQGVVQTFKFRALYDGTALSDIVVTIINTEVTI